MNLDKVIYKYTFSPSVDTVSELETETWDFF